MNDSSSATLPPRDQRNAGRYVKLNLLWALVYVACTFVLAADYVEATAPRLLLALLPSVFACFSARAYWRYLNEMDELLRAIELKALALCVAAGFVVWSAVDLVTNEVLSGIRVPVTLLVMTAFYVYGLMKGRLAHL